MGRSAGTPLKPEDPPAIGSYELISRLGTGGMGVVYLAKAADGSRVALKAIRRDYTADPVYRARFHEEVSNARKVASFCTARVLDHGEDRGVLYLVTEYIDGISLEDHLIEHGALSPSVLHAAAVGVAAALTAIHAAGLVHRDLKPANVMLTLAGPRVIDFGLARSTHVNARHTNAGMVMGTPGWIAPEQVFEGRTSPAGDVFAWGSLIAYAGLGGHPFGEGDAYVMAARARTAPPDLRGLPAPLDRLVAAAIHPDPARRPTARQLLLELVEAADEPAAELAASKHLTNAWNASEFAPLTRAPGPVPPAERTGPPAGMQPPPPGPPVPPGAPVPQGSPGSQGAPGSPIPQGAPGSSIPPGAPVPQGAPAPPGPTAPPGPGPSAMPGPSVPPGSPVPPAERSGPVPGMAPPSHADRTGQAPGGQQAPRPPARGGHGHPPHPDHGGGPAPRPDRTGPAPHADHTGPVPYADRTGPAPHADRTGPVPHADHTGPGPYVDRTGPMPHADRTGPMSSGVVPPPPPRAGRMPLSRPHHRTGQGPLPHHTATGQGPLPGYRPARPRRGLATGCLTALVITVVLLVLVLAALAWLFRGGPDTGAEAPVQGGRLALAVTAGHHPEQAKVSTPLSGTLLSGATLSGTPVSGTLTFRTPVSGLLENVQPVA
ncbi:protein kinase [Nonomuraea sp. NPDC050783]|uniref:serine/threonine-protein kinase n=1 Tax=Nonomuraea sp. NPDC050783 TaxID=3154634 RepID=UPI0034655E0D